MVLSVFSKVWDLVVYGVSSHAFLQMSLTMLQRLANQIAGNASARTLAVFTITGVTLLGYRARQFFPGTKVPKREKHKLPTGFAPEQLEKMLGNFQNLKNLQIDAKLADVDSKFIEDQVKKGLSFSSDKKFTVSVEGNIGCGKTTLLEYYKHSPCVQALREPVEQWTNIQGHNALGLLYEDPSRWSFSFNMYAQLTRVQMHLQPHTKPIKMLERSLYSTRYCFVENNYRSKTINGLEYAILKEWFEWLIKSQKATIDLIVYLRADPDTCYERIKKRDRKEESCVPKALIDDLHTLHEDWLVQQTFGELPAPVLILDANNEYEKMKTLYEDKRQEILCGYV